jgi:hypothetical protein
MAAFDMRMRERDPHRSGGGGDPVSERAKPRKIEVTGNGRQPAEPVTAGA